MLDLRPASDSLARHHARFVDEQLPEELRTPAFERFDRAPYSEQELAAGRGAWTLRALDEYRSLVAFSELISLLSQLGAPADLVGVATRVVRDEDRHVVLSGRMVVALGGEPVLDGEPNYVRAPGSSLRERALAVIVGSLCIGETFSMRVLAAMREHTQDPLAHRVVELFAADESLHSRFGWGALEVLAADLLRDERARVERWIDQGLSSAASAMRVVGDGRIGPRHPFGSIDDDVRRAVFVRTLADIARDFRALDFAVDEESWR